MPFTLAPEAEAAGYGLVVHETVGSTSADAMARLRDGAASPFWVVARRQSAGRGRRGSGWSSPAGNLYASHALRLDAAPAAIATLGFAAGVAVIRVLDACTGGARRPSIGDGNHDAPSFALKWPNDVLAGGRKLAGILLETETSREGNAVVIGIGVNVATAPDGLPYGAASLGGLGLAVTPEHLLARLSTEWIGALAEWQRGFGQIREAWLARAAGLGGPVAIRSGSDEIRGTFETIDPAGRLLVRLDDGSARRVSAGEVHFGNAASLRAEAVA